VVAIFTGLVEGVGRVRAVARDDDGVRLEVSTPLAGELVPGDSVAVNGVCLTAVDRDEDGFRADVMAATLRSSSLGPIAEGDEVNLELPLRASDRLGGHVVQGHVDGLGHVESLRQDGFARLMRVSVPPALLRYVVARGSIAIDGVSLTVAEVDNRGVTVSLIPETLARTTLGAAAPGRPVNLEVDVLAKYVEKLTPAARA
jgi:riboflavin synthase